MRRPVMSACLLTAALALSGCGSEHAAPSTTAPLPPAPNGSKAYEATAPPARLRVERRRLARDVRALRASAKGASSLKGTPAQNRATDAFLQTLQTSHLRLLERNRWIDHAAAAIAGSCDQCFQALEASRPIAAPTR